MKINQVETQVGITKKSIRFYEAQGLLTPRRNLENGYREYTPEDVTALERIKLLRKLGFPLEEIRQMQQGALTVADGMARHLVTLGRQRENLSQAMVICKDLSQGQTPWDTLDATALLAQMETLERQGTTFQNKHMGDMRSTMVAPIVITALILIAMVGLLCFLGWGIARGGQPLLVLAMLLSLSLLAVVGVILALRQRLQEIRRGELDEARTY